VGLYLINISIYLTIYILRRHLQQELDRQEGYSGATTLATISCGIIDVSTQIILKLDLYK
jgi:hypothetical protein